MDILLASIKELSEGYAYEQLQGSKIKAQIFYDARSERLEALVAASRRASGTQETDRGDTQGE